MCYQTYNTCYRRHPGSEHRENGEDYDSDFLIMLNTWEGGAGFLKGKQSVKADTTVSSSSDLAISRLLGWTRAVKVRNRVDDKLTVVAEACAAAHNLISAGHMTHKEFDGLTVTEAREIASRAQTRIRQIDQIGEREGRPKAEIRQTQKIISMTRRLLLRWPPRQMTTPWRDPRWHGKARWGTVRQDRRSMAERGAAQIGTVRQRPARQARCGVACRSRARLGVA
jgi:hypothetical protein